MATRKMTSEMWEDAFKALDAGSTIRAQAGFLGVPKSTMAHRYKNRDTSVTSYGPEPKLTTEGERKLFEWVKASSEVGMSVSLMQLRLKASNIGLAAGIPNFRGGRKWLTSARKRHPELSLRKAEMTERSRLYAVNRDTLATFYKLIKTAVTTLDAEFIWNMDEQGVDLLNMHNTLVLAPRGSKQVSVSYDGYRERITLVWFINAAGQALKPVILLPGKYVTALKLEMMKGWKDVTYILTDNATQTEASWATCARYFNKNVEGKGHYLLLDGHSSHNGMEAIQTFRDAGNEIRVLPPHTSHVMQPLDVAVARPYRVEVDKAIKLITMGGYTLDGKVYGPEAIGSHNMMRALRMAFEKFMDVGNSNKSSAIVNGFAKTGIYPFNPNAIDPIAFAPSDHFNAKLAAHKTTAGPSEAVVVEAVQTHTAQLMGEGAIDAALATAVKHRQATVPALALLTGDEYLATALAKAEEKRKEEEAKSTRQAERQAARVAKAAALEQRKAAKEAAAAAKAAAATATPGGGAAAPGAADGAPAAGTSKKKVKAAGIKRKREQGNDEAADMWAGAKLWAANAARREGKKARF